MEVRLISLPFVLFRLEIESIKQRLRAIFHGAFENYSEYNLSGKTISKTVKGYRILSSVRILSQTGFKIYRIISKRPPFSREIIGFTAIEKSSKLIPFLFTWSSFTGINL